VFKDTDNLPFASFTTLDQISAKKAARIPRLVLFGVVAACTIIIVTSYNSAKTASDQQLADIGFIILAAFTVGIVAFCGALTLRSHFEQHPRYKWIENRVHFGFSEDDAYTLLHYLEDRFRPIAPYDANLSFVMGRYSEWFASEQQRFAFSSGKVRDPHVIIVRTSLGQIMLLAVHYGSMAEMARIHAALTIAYIVEYQNNALLIQGLRDERAASRKTQPAETAEIPSLL
jgi:hypothetical protein